MSIINLNILTISIDSVGSKGSSKYELIILLNGIKIKNICDK